MVQPNTEQGINRQPKTKQTSPQNQNEPEQGIQNEYKDDFK